MDLIVNLLPWRERLTAARQRLALRVLISGLLLSAAGAALVAGEYRHTAAALQAERENLARELDIQQGESKTHRQSIAQIKEDAAKHRRNGGYVQKNRRARELLRLLSRHIPPGVWLTRLEGGSEGFVIQGSGGNAPGLFTFFQRLNAGQEGRFAVRTVLTDLTRAEDGNVTFTLRGAWEGQP